MKLFQYLTASFLLHALIWVAFSNSTVDRYTMKTPLEIEVLERDPETQNQRQIVMDPGLKELNEAIDKLKKKTNLLSARTQRVKDEQVLKKPEKPQQAAEVQATPSREPPRPQSSLDRKQPSPWDPPPLTGAGLSARAELQDHAETEKLSTVQLGSSALQEFLPDVKSGSFTSLNTDQFLFYTFYSRINEQIRNRWVENLRRFSNQTHPMEIDKLSRQRQITEVEILLDPEGRYVKTIYHNRSQAVELDEAASLAFPMAQPFINPPVEIVQDDGYIHLHYAFHVHWRPRSWAREDN